MPTDPFLYNLMIVVFAPAHIFWFQFPGIDAENNGIASKHNPWGGREEQIKNKRNQDDY